jgi:DNA-binding NtrC family response regulator
VAVVASDAAVLELIRSALATEPVTVDLFQSARDFYTRCGLLRFALVLADWNLSDATAIDFLREGKRLVPGARFVLMVSDVPLSAIVEAVKDGADDVLQKPFRLEQLTAIVRRALPAAGEPGPAPESAPAGAGAAVGSSPIWRELLDRARRVAELSSTVLIRGETGSGKEVLARYIASCSRRSTKTFLPVNCSAMPETLVESELFGHEKGAFSGADSPRAGLFEEADGGTIFLDEIGTMPILAQAKILRVLEERQVRRVGSSRNTPVDIRVLAATNLDIEAAIARREFREDLYYRLAVVTLWIPPLRKRVGDIEVLSSHFLRLLAPHGEAPKRLSPAALSFLESYPFPGNARELRHALEQAAIFSSRPELLPEDFSSLAARLEMLPGRRDLSESLAEEEVTPERLLTALRACGGNRVEAARSLKISRSTLYRLLKRISGGESDETESGFSPAA